MPCYYPLDAWRTLLPESSGKLGIVFKEDQGVPATKFQVPCGDCIGCRLEYSRQWAIRCMHEASLYEDNCFITLTYDDDHLPSDWSLDKSAWQKFFKRLRKAHGDGIRYFHCGEYGEQFRRPHYHACVFNFDFSDKVLWKIRDGQRLYTSEELSRLWPYGFSTIGAVTFESAAYVARYVTKKMFGAHGREHYVHVDKETGEWFPLVPEYATMSRRPGIGRPWLDKFSTDVFPSDSVVVRGVEVKPPKYYALQFEIKNPNAWQKIKERRLESARRRAVDNTPARLRVREKVKLARISTLKRGFENGDS